MEYCYDIAADVFVMPCKYLDSANKAYYRCDTGINLGSEIF